MFHRSFGAIQNNNMRDKSQQPLINQQEGLHSRSICLPPLNQDLQPWDRPDSSWNRAANSTLQGDPFCCGTEWQLSYHQAFAPDRSLYLRETSDSLVALARAPQKIRPNLFTPVEAHWFFGCPLLGSAAVDLLDQAIQELAQRIPSTELKASFLISGIRPRGLLYRQLRQRFQQRFEFHKLIAETQCAASLSGGLDGFLSRRSSNHRRNLKKQSQRASRKGVYFERYNPRNPAQVDSIYNRMITVEKASWKGLDECGMAEQPARHYYHLMLRRLAVSGSARIIMARHGDSDIGFIFGGIAASIYRGQQFSFADDWKKSSIGNLLQLEQISWLCEEGISRYDMGPVMGYKPHWTEKRLHIETWFLKPR